MVTGNKPKANVEDGLYAGRKSGSGEDGLGKCDPSGLATPDPTSEHAKGYDNQVPAGRRSGDRQGVNPAFDSDTSRRGNDAPISKGGSDTTKSPFSDAGKTTPAESDWDPNYKPKVR